MIQPPTQILPKLNQISYTTIAIIFTYILDCFSVQWSVPRNTGGNTVRNITLEMSRVQVIINSDIGIYYSYEEHTREIGIN